jgi:hypothetical protein
MKNPLPLSLRHYIDELVEHAPSVREVWLVGSRANGRSTEDSDWDFLLFADQQALITLRGAQSLCREGVCVLVVVDGDRFESPWPRLDNPGKFKRGHLRNYENAEGSEVQSWEWQRTGDDEATYTDRKFREERAVRVHPRGNAA